MYAADALQEMLLQTRRGRIDLFPAIPEAWRGKKISFQGFRGEKGLLISAQRAEDGSCEAVLAAGEAQKVFVRTKGRDEREICLAKGEKRTVRL